MQQNSSVPKQKEGADDHRDRQRISVPGTSQAGADESGDILPVLEEPLLRRKRGQIRLSVKMPKVGRSAGGRRNEPVSKPTCALSAPVRRRTK
jgi:hypothetical protein